MKAFFYSLAGVLTGLLVLFLLLIAVEFFSVVVHPFPQDFGGTEAEICRHVERYPAWVLAVVVPLWAIAAFSSTWIARNIGGIYAFSIVGLLLVAALGGNLAMLPYPAWFKIASLLIIPLAALAGSRLSFRIKAVEERERISTGKDK